MVILPSLVVLSAVLPKQAQSKEDSDQWKVANLSWILSTNVKNTQALCHITRSLFSLFEKTEKMSTF